MKDQQPLKCKTPQGFGFIKDVIATRQFVHSGIIHSMPSMCYVLDFTQVKMEEDTEFVLLPTEFNRLWGLTNCVNLAKYKSKKMPRKEG